jgi:DNA-binding Lrp family transcriptional regulator
MIPCCEHLYKLYSLRPGVLRVELDEIDQQIVALLRENARRSFQDIGSRVALSAPAVKRRVDRLEERGVLRGYSAVLDHAALGWTTHAVVSLFCEGGMTGAEILAAAGRNPEVAAAHTVAGEASAILHLHARDTEHLEEALERLRDAPGILRTQTQVVLSTLFERPVE